MQTQFLNPLNVTWSLVQGNSCSAPTNCVSTGTSQNPLLVTLTTPTVSTLGPIVGGSPLMLTYVTLAVANGGANDPKTAFANTWAQFSASGAGFVPANVTTWDGSALYYYPSGVGFQGCTRNAASLAESVGFGQCGSFQLLLASALQVNGITSTFVGAGTLLGENFMVQYWTVTIPARIPAPAPRYSWILNLYGDWTGQVFGGMVPPGPSFGDMVSLGPQGQEGLPGQNTAQPSEKMFGSHYFLKVDTSVAPPGQGPYFDPSYGVWYSDETYFENNAVAYYIALMPNHPDPTQYTLWAVRPKSGPTNIFFNCTTSPQRISGPSSSTCH